MDVELFRSLALNWAANNSEFRNFFGMVGMDGNSGISIPNSTLILPHFMVPVLRGTTGQYMHLMPGTQEFCSVTYLRASCDAPSSHLCIDSVVFRTSQGSVPSPGLSRTLAASPCPRRLLYFAEFSVLPVVI
jgi:hypothetical protein